MNISIVTPEIKALREAHGGATAWLECQQGIVVDVYTEYMGKNFLPKINPLHQNGNYVRCGIDNVVIQAIEVSKSE
jgi:hypothetical protein